MGAAVGQKLMLLCKGRGELPWEEALRTRVTWSLSFRVHLTGMDLDLCHKKEVGGGVRTPHYVCQSQLVTEDGNT